MLAYRSHQNTESASIAPQTALATPSHENTTPRHLTVQWLMTDNRLICKWVVA